MVSRRNTTTKRVSPSSRDRAWNLWFKHACSRTLAWDGRHNVVARSLLGKGDSVLGANGESGSRDHDGRGEDSDDGGELHVVDWLRV